MPPNIDSTKHIFSNQIFILQYYKLFINIYYILLTDNLRYDRTILYVTR